ASLAQQVPALIEFDLDLLEPHLIVVGQAILSVQVLLFVHQRLNFSEHRLVCGLCHAAASRYATIRTRRRALAACKIRVIPSAIYCDLPTCVTFPRQFVLELAAAAVT